MAKFAVAPAPTNPTPPPKVNWGWKQRAAQFYCLLLLLGFPIFSVPCQKGACSSPLEVVAVYGYAKQMMPKEWTKALLYPATVMLNAEVLVGDTPQSFRLPPWDSLLETWNLTDSVVEEEKAESSVSFRLIPNLMSMFDPNNPKSLSWEFVGACAVCLIGAALSVFGPSKISFWGVLLVLWFIFLEGGKREDVYAQPMFGLLVICSCGWFNLKEMFSLPREGEPSEAAAQPSEAAAQPKDESKKQ